MYDYECIPSMCCDCPLYHTEGLYKKEGYIPPLSSYPIKLGEEENNKTLHIFLYLVSDMHNPEYMEESEWKLDPYLCAAFTYISSISFDHHYDNLSQSAVRRFLYTKWSTFASVVVVLLWIDFDWKGEKYLCTWVVHDCIDIAPSHLCNALRVFQFNALQSTTLLSNGRVASQTNAQRVA